MSLSAFPTALKVQVCSENEIWEWYYWILHCLYPNAFLENCLNMHTKDCLLGWKLNLSSESDWVLSIATRKKDAASGALLIVLSIAAN